MTTQCLNAAHVERLASFASPTSISSYLFQTKSRTQLTKSNGLLIIDSLTLRFQNAQDLTNCPLLSSSQSRSNVFEQVLKFNFPDNSSLIESTSHMWASTIRTNQQHFQPLARVACALGTLVLGKQNNDFVAATA